MNGENLALQFASWSINTKYDQIPDSVKKCARRAMTDTLGVIVAGSVHTKVVALVNALSSHRGRSSVFKNNRLSATNAATINGMAAHVWDFDDTSYTGVIHGSAIVLPAILAVAENIDASESDLISAFIVGSEVTYTLGEICTHNHFLSGWWSTGSCATIGATAAVCRLLRLDKNQCASAIGTAAVSSGVVRAIAGTDAKPYLAGQAAGQAIEIARAAQAGLTGPLDAFEQENGFFNLLNDGHSSINEASSLGIRWRIQDPGLLFKTSPVCSAAHAAIDEMAKITQNHGRPVEDIVEIVAEIPDLVRKSLVSPKPTNPQEAQFSLPYAIA